MFQFFSGNRNGFRPGKSGGKQIWLGFLSRLRLPSLWGLKTESFKHEQDIVRPFFDADYYLKRNQDVAAAGIDPIDHYFTNGWREGRDPNADFNTTGYLLLNIDVLQAGMNPFYHYIAFGKKEGRDGSRVDQLKNDFFALRLPHLLQNRTFPNEIEFAEKIMVILIPEHNTMSGGIFSFFSIARAVYDLRQSHDYAVVLMTRPNRMDVTYCRQTNFRNCEDVFRFQQITRCKNAKTVYINVPEYASAGFVRDLEPDTFNYLMSRDCLFINILNQNIELMPKKEELADLRSLATELTQSVAHHAYYGQEFADKFDLPTLLLPAYTDLSGYAPTDFDQKEKLIIYSPDDAPHKKKVLSILQKDFPEYRFVEIRNMKFDKFMDYATRCMFSISFGEGFDGYISQPTQQGGIGLSVYNDEFFPSPELKKYQNIFENCDEMIMCISSRIKSFIRDPELFRQTNKAMLQVYDKLYSKEEYLRQIKKLTKREFELYPRVINQPVIRL